MKRALIAAAVILAIGAGGYYYTQRTGDAEAAAGGGARGGAGGPGGAGGQGGPGGRGFRVPMTVEVGQVRRADMAETLTVVGNLIGAATVEATPKVAGRIESVSVQLGDRVSRGQPLAKVEDQELREQIRQAQASYEVSAATIRQREADLRLAQTNLDRSRNLFERQLIPRQTFDDTDARQQAAAAQLDLAKAQFSQAQARLDELKINLANTVIISPVSGFIGRRLLDAGAWVTPASSFLSVVDISTVRLVANIVEKDLRKVSTGMTADVAVDAFPGERFTGRIAHVAPVLDPSTRTAQIEIRIENAEFRLKPGMYANVNFTTAKREKALVVPTRAVVDMNGSRGVFVPVDDNTAKFKAVSVGMIDGELAEIAEGLSEGDRVVTTGAAALREGDQIVLAGQGGRGGRGGRGGQQQPGAAGTRGAPTGAPGGQAPAEGASPGGRAGGPAGRVGQSS
jgi:RND family efflux transporter MFP subunit